MKFSIFRKIFIIILFAVVSLPRAMAEGNHDFMRETGKIYVVVAVIVAILLSIAWYIFRLDNKLTKIEHQIFQEDNERKN